MEQGEQKAAAKTPVVGRSRAQLLETVKNSQLKTIPAFRPGDSVKVHAKIREGGKERVQIFEGLVIRRHNGSGGNGSFTVRKISYNVGVERTFFLHSPMIEKIEVVSVGEVRRARLYYLRDLRGKSARIRSQLLGATSDEAAATPAAGSTEQASA